jgi:hypothetical protein
MIRWWTTAPGRNPRLVHLAGPAPDHGGRDAGPQGDALGADPSQRRRDEPVDRQAGAGHRRVRYYLPACEHCGRGAECGQCLPLSPPADVPHVCPPGVRGDAPIRAARYWGLSQQEYYARADVWPLAPQGEILAIIQCEEMRAIDNLPRILQAVPGIGVVLIGEGDLSQELGHPRDYEHPVVADAINSILKICQEHHVPCGHPHPDARNIERLIAGGYRFLMPSAPRSFAVLDQGRKLAGRD